MGGNSDLLDCERLLDLLKTDNIQMSSELTFDDFHRQHGTGSLHDRCVGSVAWS